MVDSDPALISKFLNLGALVAKLRSLPLLK